MGRGDIAEAVISDVEGFPGGNPVVGEFIEEEAAGFCLAVVAGKEGFLGKGEVEGLQGERGVELGVGDDADGGGV